MPRFPFDVLDQYLRQVNDDFADPADIRAMALSAMELNCQSALQLGGETSHAVGIAMMVDGPTALVGAQIADDMYTLGEAWNIRPYLFSACPDLFAQWSDALGLKFDLVFHHTGHNGDESAHEYLSAWLLTRKVLFIAQFDKLSAPVMIEVLRVLAQSGATLSPLGKGWLKAVRLP